MSSGADGATGRAVVATPGIVDAGAIVVAGGGAGDGGAGGVADGAGGAGADGVGCGVDTTVL